MVVDDSVVMRNLVAHMIEEMPGVEVAGRAINGRLALQKLPAINPDVIILDLEMPEMNGIQFLEERRERGIDIPVVIPLVRCPSGGANHHGGAAPGGFRLCFEAY